MSNICSYFLTTVFNFLQVDGLNSLHSVKSTPNRFTKTSQGRSWNTGNGSPDAICFSVDKPGVVVVGFSVYGGGGIHEYELEVLVDDVSTALGKIIWTKVTLRGFCREYFTMGYFHILIQSRLPLEECTGSRIFC